MHTSTATKKLFIGNLPDRIPTTTVEGMFEKVGRVLSVAVVRNGFAFVEMTADDADKACRQLNGLRLEGRAVTIEEAHARGTTRY
jgi:RNA recognition motif-containing protein